MRRSFQVFKDASDDSVETKNELRDLPNEVIDSDGADQLPDEISLDNDMGNNSESQKDFEDIVPENDLQSDTEKSNMDTSEVGETDEPREKKGGSYRDVKKTSDGETYEVHHMPADSASHLERDDGPAIKMEKEDHRQTASCGSSREAREYREEQRKLIEQGKFREALQMDIDDIHDKFGDKYDDAIAEMLEYVDQLEQEGKIDG